MKAWLITHNPDNWTWPDLENKIKKVQNGEKIVESWTCGSKKVALGDRVFLMRTGKQGRGIVGAGHCIKESYDSPHYDPEKASSGVTTAHIDVEFDWIIDIENARYIQQDALKEKFSEQEWSPMGSGIAIKDDYSYGLELEWARCIGVEHDVYNLLKASKEIDPDVHDGSYELVRETVRAFSTMPAGHEFNFADLDLVYLMAIIFNSTDRNKNAIKASSLLQNEKDRLENLLENVWNKAQENTYENIAKKPMSVGMFGTGFYTFNKPTSDPMLPQKIISALIDIANTADADEIYQHLKDNYKSAIKGIGVAAFSVMAHCLNPRMFPIVNNNEGFGNVFLMAGFKEFRGKTISDYAQFSRELSEYRDRAFNFKNYRTMDLIARMTVNIDFIGVLNYIEANGGKPYESPKKSGLAPARVKELNALEKSGKEAIVEVDKMASCIEEEFGLKKDKKSRWSDGSGTKVRSYLWQKLYYPSMDDTVDSISIFVEKSDSSTHGRENRRIRFSIEMVNEDASQVDYDAHHKVLDLPIGSGLVYVVSGNGINTIVANEDVSSIKAKLANGTYKKVQISKVIEFDPGLTNADYFREMMVGVEALIPYYDYVIGKDSSHLEMSGSDATIKEMKEKMESSKAKVEKNTILFGPPGTGKTYSTAIYAVAICDGPDKLPADYEGVMERYRELRDEGRIAFTTFHQSYGYEEFIEGISPKLDDDSTELGYFIKDGVFKAFCEKASRKIPVASGSAIIENPSVWCVILGGSENPDLKQDCFDEGTIRIGWNQLPEVITEDTEDANDKERRILLNFQDEMEIGDIVVVRSSKTGVNGVGVVTGEAEFDSSNDHYPRKRKVDWIHKGEEIEIVDLNGDVNLDRKSVYPLTRVNAGDLLARIPGSTTIEIETETRPHVFIIDEINRGNISKIFGELITLIEDTKRSGCNECVPAVLPYSQKPFSVPDNVYILGTMNTADRSIALIDTALRRRFHFVEMMPESDVLKSLKESDGTGTVVIDGVTLDVVKLLDTINNRIAVLYDREHTIGHAFFTPLIKNPTMETLSGIFEKKVLPLLQEYFYEDYSKIQLVLADNAKSSKDLKFVLDNPVKIKGVFKGNADEILNTEDELVEYTIQKDAFTKIQSYIEIYN